MYHISPKLYFDRLNLWNIFQVNSFSISIILSAVSHKFCLDQNASRLYSFRYCLSPFEFEQNLCPQGSRLKLLRKPTHNREDRLPFNRNTTWPWNVKTKIRNLCNFGNHHCCIFPKYNCSWQCLPEKDWYKIDLCAFVFSMLFLVFVSVKFYFLFFIVTE